MKKKLKKQWTKPTITTSLKIKKTLSNNGPGSDNGPNGMKRLS